MPRATTAVSGLILTLVFERHFVGDPLISEVSDVLQNVEVLYRVVRLIEEPGIEPGFFKPDSLPASLFKYGRNRPYLRHSLRQVLEPTGQAEELIQLFDSDVGLLRLRTIRMGSPLDLALYIPAIVAARSTALWFLRALEQYFNMPTRIRTERVDLEAKQAEREADSAEAHLRAERARQQIKEIIPTGLGGYRLIDGEVRPDEDVAPL